MQKSECLQVQRLSHPYPTIDVHVQPEQEQFIDPVGKALSNMTEGEVPFAVRLEGKDVGFFTLRPSHDDEVEQLRSASSCTLRSFMIDARQQGKGLAGKALAQLPGLVATTFTTATSIGLTVNCRNTQAYRLYTKNGFRDLGALYHGGAAGPQHIMTMDLFP